MNDTEWYLFEARRKVVDLSCGEVDVLDVAVKANRNGVLSSGDMCDSPWLKIGDTFV